MTTEQTSSTNGAGGAIITQPTKPKALRIVDGRYFYTNMVGDSIELTHFPPLQASLAEQAARQRAYEQFGEPVKPTYTVEDTGETFEHDETTLETDEQRAAWEKWKQTTESVTAYVGEQMMRFFLFYGVKANPKDDPEWEARQLHFGIKIPTDPIDKKIHYVQTELVYGQKDIADIARYLMTLAGVREELISAAADSFRDPVAEQ